MGKKRIVKKTGQDSGSSKARTSTRAPRRKVEAGIYHVQSTYNNTKVMLTDKKGGALCWSSSGSLGFKGAKKGTPFAAAKIGEVMAEKAQTMGLKEVEIFVNGVGSGRESAIRSFVSRGINISSIKDITPIPHGGVRRKKPRRV